MDFQFWTGNSSCTCHCYRSGNGRKSSGRVCKQLCWTGAYRVCLFVNHRYLLNLFNITMILRQAVRDSYSLPLIRTHWAGNWIKQDKIIAYRFMFCSKVLLTVDRPGQNSELVLIIGPWWSLSGIDSMKTSVSCQDGSLKKTLKSDFVIRYWCCYKHLPFFPFYFLILIPTLQGPVVRRWVKFNPWLGETSNIIPSSRNAFGFFKLLLKNT